MMIKTAYYGERTCPKCHSGLLKNWDELSFDERFLTERLEKNTEFSKEERKKHLFCTKCWFETPDSENFA